ncbi:MAG: carboxypeptidase-like regulatory domain-containing protein [Bacteroidales bacterium]
MTNPQESRFGMINTVLEFGDRNQPIVSQLPQYTENHEKLKALSGDISIASEQQRIDTKGSTADKNHLADTLITLVADCARKLTAYAKLSNNLTLLGEVNMAESTFRHLSNTALHDYSQIIYDRGQENFEHLAEYEITTESQAALLLSIQRYGESLVKPRLNTTLTRQATKRLEVLFEKANAVLENMDAAVGIIRLSQPNFYNGYRTARKVINVGTRSLTLKGIVTDSVSGEPLKGVTVQFCPECESNTAETAANGINNIKPEVVLTKITAQKGGFNIKSLPNGVYKVTLSKPGYIERVVKIPVITGELNELSVELTPN